MNVSTEIGELSNTQDVAEEGCKIGFYQKQSREIKKKRGIEIIWQEHKLNRQKSLNKKLLRELVSFSLHGPP